MDGSVFWFVEEPEIEEGEEDSANGEF